MFHARKAGKEVTDSARVTFETYLRGCETIRRKNDFKVLTHRNFRQFKKGSSFVHNWKGHLPFISSVYPQLPWTIYDMDKTSNTFWSGGTEKSFLEYLAQRINYKIETLFDWQSLEWVQILTVFSGRGLLVRSILEILECSFPEFFWERGWRFPTAGDQRRKRVFMDGLILKIFQFVVEEEDLADITSKDLLSSTHVASTLLQINQDSMRVLFQHTYPEFSKFRVSVNDPIPRRLFGDRFIIKFLEFVCTQHDLVQLNNEIFTKYPGGQMFLSLSGSPKQAFSYLYPELMPKYKSAERGFWNNLSNNELLQSISRQYHIRHPEDWYRLSVDQLNEFHGRGVKKKNIFKLFIFWYPEIEWDSSKFSRMNKKSRQRYLGLKLKEIFKENEIMEEFVFRYASKTYLFDFYIPSRSLMIEYQGEQHYFHVLKWWSLEEQKKRDEEKRDICSKNGFKLIYIPYWWDNSIDSLQEFLAK